MGTLTIGERIKNARKEQGFTQEALAEAIGRTPNVVARWERGEVNMRADVVRDIAFALGVSIASLMEDDEPKEAKDHFVKISEYKDKTKSKNTTPNMTYWGALFDNAEKAALYGKNLDTIICIVQDALNMLIKARDEQRKENEE
ncbi:MAG: helix-turn-helix transcriptional regulator [Synergistaceae bacterium]|nr:helix-turn-helix transcriptional regulator [Synergistaceae bacterium]